MSEENKAKAKHLAELAVAYLATGLQILARNRSDLAQHFFMQAAGKAAQAKHLDNETKLANEV